MKRPFQALRNTVRAPDAGGWGQGSGQAPEAPAPALCSHIPPPGLSGEARTSGGFSRLVINSKILFLFLTIAKILLFHIIFYIYFINFSPRPRFY